MLNSAGRIGACILASLMVAGCSTMGPSGVIVNSTSASRPMAASVRVQTPAPQTVTPGSLQGMDFTQAVAALASTPGSGVTSVGRPAAAMALAPDRPPAQPPRQTTPTTPRPAAQAAPAKPAAPAAQVAAAAPAPQFDPKQCFTNPSLPGCPATDVFGQEIVPVNRF